MNSGRNMMILFWAMMAICLKSCREPEQEVEPVVATPYEIDIPMFFPTMLNIPADNPMTEEGVELGRYLFYDPRLSGRTHPDSLMSCGSCHLQSRNFECGVDHPKYIDGFTFGITGKVTPHVMLPLVNLVWNHNGYLWNGVVSPQNGALKRGNIEDLVWMGVLAEHEMNGDTSRVARLFQSIPGYPDLFNRAFGSPVVTMDRISKAIAQFIRTLISANSRFDKYMRGEVQLTMNELNGFILFTTEEGADCFHCHGGYGNPLFTTNLFYNNGKDTLFTGAHEDIRDRYHVTGDEMERGAYKATTLRNINLSGPFMHDGRYATLDEVIDFYSHNIYWSSYIDPLMHHVNHNGVQLTPLEKADLKTFILTLQDDDFLTNPQFSAPPTFPDGKNFN